MNFLSSKSQPIVTRSIITLRLNRLFISHLLALSLAGVGAAQAGETQTVASFKRIITKTVGYEYLVALPTGYDAAADKQWPVILFLHGSGERGADPWLVTQHGPPKLLRGDALVATNAAPDGATGARALDKLAAGQLRSNFIVISPQCPVGSSWDDDAVLALLDEVAAKHKTDPRRIYLTGLSMGGYGTWSVGLKFPERFAAIVPICGGGQYSDVMRSSRAKKAAFLSLATWAFHGAKDPTVPLEESARMVAALKKVGVTDVQFTVYPEAKHDSWTETYANPELYVWLLKHQR